MNILIDTINAKNILELSNNIYEREINCDRVLVLILTEAILGQTETRYHRNISSTCIKHLREKGFKITGVGIDGHPDHYLISWK